MAAFSDGAFSKPAAFSENAFDFGAAPPAAVVGGHFAGRKKKRTDDEWREKHNARTRLRQQIRSALDGPAHVAASVEAAIAEYVAPQKSDSRYVPVQDRIRWDLLYRKLDLVEMQVLMHIAAAEDEDDEDWLLLNG